MIIATKSIIESLKDGSFAWAGCPMAREGSGLSLYASLPHGGRQSQNEAEEWKGCNPSKRRGIRTMPQVTEYALPPIATVRHSLNSL